MYQINSILLLLLIFTNQYLSQNLINKTINETSIDDKINKIDDFDIGHNDNHNEISISLLELFENFNVKYHDDNFEMISFDGWYHDLHQPDLGSIGSSLKRFFSSSSSKVDKQIDSNRSINHNDNVFRISESLFKTNRIHYYSMNGRNLLSIYFGMFVLNDMLDTMKDKCPMNYRKISLPKTYIDQYGNEIAYNSSIYDDNAHDYIYVNDFENCKLSSSINDRKSRINFRSIWIDGEIIYGNSKFCSDYVRTFERGKLIDFTSGINDKYRSELFGRECFNYYGNNPINENPFMITIHFIWINLHNLIAEIINKQNTGLTDQFIYDQSRKYTIAILQNIVFNEWLPSLIGEQLPRYHGYDSMIDPRITDLFDLLSNTYLYTMLTSFVFRLNPMECKKKQFNYSILRLCNTYYEPLNYFKQNNFQNLLFGLLLQSSKRNDHYLINDILLFAKNDLYNHNYNYNRKNLFALLLQHSRDYRLDDYLTIRRKIGMDIDYNYNNQTFEDLLNNQWSFAKSLDEKLEFKLRNLYNNNVDQIDLLVGGLLENQGNGQPGELIRYVLMEQFLRLRNGDRFYFENSLNHQFTHEQIEQIKLIKFSDIIKSITLNNDYNLIQKNVFELPNTGDNRISTECFNHLRKLLQIYPCIDSNDQDRNDGNTENTRNCITLSTLNINETSEQCLVDTKFINYFNGSELSFILTLLSIPLFIIVLILIMKLLIYRRNKMNETQRIKVSKLRRMTINDDSCTIVQEYVGRSDGYRNIILVLDLKMKAIIVKLQYESRIVRSIYLRKCTNDCRIHIELSINQSQNYMLIRFPKEYDLILKFDSYYDREKFLTKFEKFLNDIHYPMERSTKDLRSILKSAYTKSKRQKHLEKFFNVLFSQAFNHQQNQQNPPNKSKNNLDLKTFKEIMATELTEFEFAEVLSMRPEASFVKQMFRLIDKDNNGYISFREFLDVIIIFTKGSAEQKIRIMFDMYDVDQNERLSIDDFSAMIKSLLEIANQSVSAEEMNETIRSMLVENGFTSKKELTFDDFSRLFHNYKEELGYTELNFDLSKLDKLPSIATHLKSTATSSSANNNLNKIKRQSKLMRANDLIVQSYFGGNSGQDFTKLKQTPTFLKIETQENQIEPDWFVSWIRFLDARKKEIFFLILYNLIALIIFIDKAYYYVSLNESSGLRQIAGMGIPITRGSASVMMFNFSTILLTMCRNLITMIRETFLHRFIPFDSVVSFHKYIAYLAFIMSLIHSFGHISNFYHVSTQRPSDLNCILSETYFRSNEMPKFHHWAFETLTGLTGILLLALLFIIYIFAIPYSRRHIFNAFWLTHSLYPLFYLLMVLHGLGRLVQPPIFYCYFVIPLTLFTIDKLISASRKKIEISVINATLHPSNVTHLEFKKPPNFDYKSGQWLRIACLGLNPNEYHPFTIASAPHESTLSLYIRAVGPFTKNIRQMYDHNLLNGRPYPKLYLDGPYGEGHQDWFRFDVSVLVGGGIGITPFASIIKDITFRSSINAKINCKKVYFIWVTRTQKHFEWMSDVIREAEEKDVNNLLVTHIFITQFYEKFDLRTTMLYICERHFQRISNKSLFTGLRAKTHFGRPNFEVFFDSLQYEHRNVERVGVFSCGPNPMTNSVQQACDRLNRKEGIIFNHHFENF